MDFWSFIETHRQRPLDVESASVSLEVALKQLSQEDLASFCEQFDQRMNEAYTWDLWGVAYLIQGGCSDDTFMDFRASLVALGKEVFSRAIADAESLLDLEESELEALFEEGLLYVGPEAYRANFEADPPRSGPQNTEPSGQPWEEERETLMSRFPRAWSRYGWDEDGEEDPAPASKDSVSQSLLPDPANRGRRLLAKLIDVTIVALTILGLTSMTGSSFIGLLVGYGWLLISDGDSASPGKWLFKLQAVSATDGRPCHFGQSALRNAPLVLIEADNFHRAWLGIERELYIEQFPWVFGLFLVLSTFYYVVALFVMYRDPLQRRPGDRFGGTVVRRRIVENPLRG